MYKDRGIIKWAPFDALIGFNSLVNEMLYKKYQKEKPFLSEDKLEELDRTIKIAITNENEIQISYYEDGYIKTVTDKIKKVDLHKRLLYLKSNFSLYLDTIIDLID